jgi:hypothetical protein
MQSQNRQTLLFQRETGRSAISLNANTFHRNTSILPIYFLNLNLICGPPNPYHIKTPLPQPSRAKNTYCSKDTFIFRGARGDPCLPSVLDRRLVICWLEWDVLNPCCGEMEFRQERKGKGDYPFGLGAGERTAFRVGLSAERRHVL